MPLRSPVFILGSPRSGTTLLYHQLLSAGGFAIYRTEVKAYHYLAPLAGHFRSRAGCGRFLDKWFASEDFLRSGLNAETFRDRVLEECHSAGDFQRLLMESICENQGALRWADCTPENVLFMAAIRRDFPDARFIHMIRDGRDVAHSLVQQRWIRPFRWDKGRPVLAAAVFWDWMVDQGRKAGRRIGDYYLEVHYRDLVRQPRETLAVIAGFLDHNVDYDRIQKTGIGSVTKPNTSFPSELHSHQFSPMDRWKRGLGEAELRLVETLVGPLLVKLGYELANAPASLSGRLADRVDRRLYRASFGAKVWLKAHSSLSGRFASADLLGSSGPPPDDADPTLRPGAHLDFVRSLVSQGRPQ